CVRAELAEGLDDARELRLRPGEVAGLDVVDGEHLGCVEDEVPGRVGRPASLVARVEEPVAEELELDVPEPVLVEERADVAQRRAVREHVLEIGVPDTDAAEADARGVRAAVPQREQAPLASGVHLDGTGDRPIETDHVGVGAHRWGTYTSAYISRQRIAGRVDVRGPTRLGCMQRLDG